MGPVLRRPGAGLWVADSISCVSPARAYVDHAASTDLLPQAREAWLAAAEAVGNPSSLHTSGRRARRIVEESRESVAADLGVRASEVIFTASGTEADNLAVKGFAWLADPQGRRDLQGRRIVSSPIEHHAVLDPVLWLGEQGYDVSWLPVNDAGRVDPSDVRSALGSDVALCTVMWANNEVGTIQPIADIAAACAEVGVPFHSDAVQALGVVPLDGSLPGLTSLALSGHKIGAPTGVGALVLSRDATLVPVLHGGGQERDLRSGTLDAASIAAFAVAVHIAVAEQDDHARHLAMLANSLREGIRGTFPQAVFNGDEHDRLPGNVHVSFPGAEGDALLMLLDAAGVECSTGSACTAGIPEPSHVLLAMGVPADVARGSLRFSFGRSSSTVDVDAILAALPSAVDRASRASVPRMTRTTRGPVGVDAERVR